MVQSLLLRYCILEGNLNYVSLEIDFVLSAILNRRVPFLFACGSRTFIVETRYQSATGNLVVITAGLCVSERDLCYPKAKERQSMDASTINPNRL